MNMRKITLLLLACALPCLGQENPGKQAARNKPDFSGTWSLDRSKSELGRLGQRMANVELTYVIIHKDPELKVIRKTGAAAQGESAYYSDGRGETNPNLLGRGDVKSKTKWDGTKLVSRSTATIQGRRDDFYIDTTQKWEMSPDSKTLTVTISITPGQPGLNFFKQVFNRVPSE